MEESMIDPDSYHNVFVNGDWNLEEIGNYFGDTRILAKVLERRSCTVDIIKLLLEQGEDINCADYLGHSPLAIALQNSDDEEVIRLLLERGAEVNKIFGFKKTPLLILLQKEDCSVGIVKLLLDYGAQINCMDVYGKSPLTYAIQNVKDDMVIRVLVERGAEVNDLKNLHNTPLLVLLRRRKNCSVDTVKLLLEKGANVNCMDECGCSPLVTALENSRDEEIIQALLENGATVNIICKNGKTPLLLYLGRRYLAGNGCSVGIVKLLLHYKAEVNSINSGDSPLITALKNSRGEKIIRMLLEEGAGVNTLDGSGKSTLCIAFRHSSNDIVKLLLDAGSSPNACEIHTSALHCATDFSCSGLREDILNLLLLDTSINANNIYGQSVLCYAIRSGAKAQDIQLLLNAGASLNACVKHSSPLICATDGRTSTPLREDVVKLLLDHGTSVDDKALIVLQSALRYCKYETGAIQLLLDLPGMDAYVVTNECNESLLHFAVQNPNCRINAMKLLVNRKAKVDLKNKSGETPLHCAVRNESCDPNVINLLLQHGSPANAKNKSGETPLTLAMKLQCHANIFKELLIAGAHFGKIKFFHRSVDLKLKFSHCGEEFKLLEFLEKEYEASIYPLKDSYKMLVKFFFLQYPECDIGDLQRATRVMWGNNRFVLYWLEELWFFVAVCLSELRKMDLMQVGHGHTFREFIAGNPDDENYDLGQILQCMMENSSLGFLDVIVASFPVFLDIIFARIKKLMIKQKYCPNSLKVGRVNLDSGILCKISTFLSDDDFLKFVLAFYTLGKIDDSDETLLGKRNSEPSTKPFKYPKLYH